MRSSDPRDRAEIRRLLRDAGLRATPARVATYEVLAGASTPLTHAQVVDLLDASGVERTTIYRNLIDLAEAGLVVRSDLGDHTWRFELIGGHRATHGHFVCVDCGDVSCLAGVEVTVQGRAVSQENIEVQLRGRCDACT